VRVVINSYGGDLLEGLLIYNYLKGLNSEVEVHIPAYAMSAATIIAAAGDHVTMSDKGYYMIHNPWTVEIGDQHAMQGTADLLRTFASDMAAIYAQRTGLDQAVIQDMMDAETWLTAEQALQMGFVDELTPGARFEASMPANIAALFANVPAELATAEATPEPTPEPIQPKPMNIWQKIVATLSGAEDDTVLMTENEQRLTASLNTALSDAEARQVELNDAQAAIAAMRDTIDQLQGDLDAANARITELEAAPAATHTNGRTDGDIDNTKPWDDNPVRMRAREIAQGVAKAKK
jgi:hypothetical protein